MRNGSGKLNVPHALTAHFGARHFDAALFADNTLITYSFILTAMAFPVLRRSENFLAEKTVAFGFLGAVVDGFGFCDFPVRPFPDFFGRRYADLNGIEIV